MPCLPREFPFDPAVQPEVLLIDYGMGNLKSVARAVEASGCRVRLVDGPLLGSNPRVLILPGVGAFPAAMKKLQTTGMEEWIRESVADGAWLLGICLGMQLLMEQGEEFGITAGLGLIPGKVEQIPSLSPEGQTLKLPHIGWSSLFPSQQLLAEKSLWQGIVAGEHFYFVHSFFVKPKDPAAVLGSCHYGGHILPAVIGKNRVIGCQFHPEKSGPAGLNFLGNFLRMADDGRKGF